ncbi:MAG: helix-turn-helix domain-containing protein [Cetobacterium sp.]
MKDTVVSPSVYNVRRAAMILGTISPTNQCRDVLNHIIMKGSISPLEADSIYRVKRLTSRVHDLKKMGVAIVSDLRKDITNKKYARYYIAA